MKIRAIGDKIIVRPDPAAVQSTGGIILTATDTTAQDQGTVIAVGPGTYNEDGEFVNINVSEGDRVVYNKHTNARSTLTVDGDEYVFLTEDSIFAII